MPKTPQEDTALPEVPRQPPEPVSNREAWAVLFLAHDTPVSLSAGDVTTVNLRLRNTGTTTWSRNARPQIHLGYQWLDESKQVTPDPEDHRTALPFDLAPGQEAALGAVLAAPRKPGLYQLRWDMIIDRVGWFPDPSTPLVVPVSITATPHDVTGWRVESNLNPQQVAWALDGDPRTFWDSRRMQAPGQWFRLNLSASRMLDGIQFLSPGKGFPDAYCLRVSGDGSRWTEIARHAGGNGYDVMSVFAPQQVRYAQIDLLGTPAAPTSWMLSEILIHLAAPWTASASHNTGDAGLAIDNRGDTAWSSQVPQAPGMWFQIDLGRVETVSGLALLPPSEASEPHGELESPMSYRIATWNARASRWQIACEKSNQGTPVDVIFTATQTQFINIQLLQPGTRPWVIRQVRVIREMETWLGPGT